MNIITIPRGGKITEPGAYTLDIDEYHADPTPGAALSQSIIKVLLDSSPAHARIEHPKLAPASSDDDDEREKYDKTKAIGDVAHTLLIGRGKEIAVGAFKTWASKDAKAFRDNAEKMGETIILEKHYDQAVAVSKATRAALDLGGFKDSFRDGAGEIAVFAVEDGVWLKALIDWSEPGFLRLHDYKTSGLSAHEAVIPAVLSDAEWGIQAAMQERILDALDPDNAGRRKFFFHLQENYEPFAMRSVQLTEAALALGRRKVAAAIQIWRRCIKANDWPAYPLEVFHGTHTQWAESRWLEREIAMHEAGLIDNFADPVLAKPMPSRGEPRSTILAG